MAKNPGKKTGAPKAAKGGGHSAFTRLLSCGGGTHVYVIGLTGTAHVKVGDELTAALQDSIAADPTLVGRFDEELTALAAQYPDGNHAAVRDALASEPAAA